MGIWILFCMNHNDERKHVHHFIIPIGTDLSKGRPIDAIQVEVDLETVCQYTGFPDKNDTMIFENDKIFEAKSENSGIVKFGLYDGKHYGFHIVWSGLCIYRQDICYWANLIEAVGSIYDNQ